MRIPRLLPIAVLCALGLTAGLVLGLGHDDPAPPAAADPPAAGSGEVLPGEVAAALPAWTDPDVDGAVTTTPDELPAEIREAAAQADPSESPRVRVVRGEPPAPVADVEVLFTTIAEARGRLGDRLPGRHYEWPELCGRRTVTGADGVAALPPTPAPYLACARAPGEFAFAFVPPGDRTVDLRLLPDEQLVVAVVDAEERPVAGAPLDVLQHDGRAREADVLWSGETAADGRAVLHHFQFLRQRPDGGEGERFAALLRVAASAPVVAEFAGRPAPADPVLLRLPALQPVDVLLTDHRDVPLLSPATVFLAPPRTERQASDFPLPRRSGLLRLPKAAGAGPVRFSWVAAGTPVRPGARFPAERRPLFAGEAKVHVAGAGGAPPVLRLPVEAPLAVLAGRLALDGGAPLASQTVHGVFWRAEDPAGAAELTTVADGRFDLVRESRGDEPLVLELRTTIADEAGSRVVGCRASFRMPAPGLRVELGDLVLGELPPACHGVVVDDRNEPVPGAAVVVQRRELVPPRSPAERGGRGRSFRGERPLRPGGDGQPTERWPNVPLLDARTDAEGRFLLFGRRPPGELRVRADTDRHFADAVAWHREGQELRIRIERNGVIDGRALLPPWLPDAAASLTLQPFDETSRREHTRTVELSRRRGGRFRVEPLRAGRYDAIVRLRNLPDPVLTVPDVFVEPGPTADGRLAALDLRQAVFRFLLRAVDLGGRPLPIDSPLLMRWQQADGSAAQAGFRWRRGRAEFYSPSSFVELVSFAPGCEPQVVSVGPGEVDVAMRQLVPAQLLLPGARALCGPERRVRVSVILVGDSGYPQWLSGIDQRTGEQFSFPRWELGKSTGAWLEHGDLVSVPVVKDGRYEVVLRIHATESTGSQQVSVPLGEFDLRCDGTARAPVTIPIDAQQVLDAIARFRPPEPTGGAGRSGRR